MSFGHPAVLVACTHVFRVATIDPLAKFSRHHPPLTCRHPGLLFDVPPVSGLETASFVDGPIHNTPSSARFRLRLKRVLREKRTEQRGRREIPGGRAKNSVLSDQAARFRHFRPTQPANASRPRDKVLGSGIPAAVGPPSVAKSAADRAVSKNAMLFT